MRTSLKRLLPIALITVLLAAMAPAAWGCGGSSYEVPIADEAITIASDEGVVVTIPPYVVREDTKLKVASSDKAHVAAPNEEDEILSSVRVELGDQEALNGVLEIKIPYDRTALGGTDPGKALYVVTEDYETGEPEYALTDIGDGYVTVYTDHLSYYDLYFESREKNTEYEDKLRRAGIYFNRQSLEAYYQSLKSGDDAEQAAAELGWEAFNSGLGASGDFAAIAQLAQSSSQMNGFLTGFGSLGNIAFYLGVAKDVVQGLKTGDYSQLQSNLAQGVVGFGIGNFAGPGVQAAYAAVKLTLYYGGKLSDYVKGEAYAKFDAAYTQVYDRAMLNRFKEQKPETVPWETKYRIYWFNKMLEIYRLGDGADFAAAVKEAVEAEVRVPLGEEYKDDLNMYLAEYAQQEQSEDYWFFKSYNLREGEDLTNFINIKTAEKVKELQPVFERVANYLMFKAEKEYYQKYMEIKTRYEQPAVLTFEINGKNVDDYDINVEFNRDGRTLQAFNTHGLREVKHPMSMRDYVEMGAPDVVRLMVIKPDGVDEYRKDFKFSFENQTIEFDLKDEPAAPTKEEEPPATGKAEEPPAEIIIAQGGIPADQFDAEVDYQTSYLVLRIDATAGTVTGECSIEFIEPIPDMGMILVNLQATLDGDYAEGKDGEPARLEGSYEASVDISEALGEFITTEYLHGSWVAEMDDLGYIGGAFMGTEDLLGYELYFEAEVVD